MEQVSIKVSTAGIEEPFIETVQRGQTIEELKSQGYTEEDIVSHVVRDENSNVGNAARAALSAAVKEGITDRDTLAKIVHEAAERYESGERAVRSRGGATALIGKVMKWALSTPENIAAYQNMVTEVGAAKALTAITEMYTEAHPAKEKATK